MVSGIPQQSKAKARLPKREVRRLNGNSGNGKKSGMSFKTPSTKTKGSLEPARSTIAGFFLTAVNYAAAVDVLKKKYGKETAMQCAHMNDLLNLVPVSSDKDTTLLRKL